MIFAREIELPMKVRGFTAPDPDGNYNVYINANLSDEAKKEALKHELSHIKRNHFYDDSIKTCIAEMEADNEV